MYEGTRTRENIQVARDIRRISKGGRQAGAGGVSGALRGNSRIRQVNDLVDAQLPLRLENAANGESSRSPIVRTRSSDILMTAP